MKHVYMLLIVVIATISFTVCSARVKLSEKADPVEVNINMYTAVWEKSSIKGTWIL